MELFTTFAVSFATTLGTNAFKNAKVPGQALDDLLILAGFNKLHLKAEAQKQEEYRQYKERIGQEIIKTPEEYLQKPRPSIAGPALEVSKYYLGEPELKELFAKLVASSMDSRKNEIVHPSFVEIIKQLSPVDAQLFSKISKTLYPKRAIDTADVLTKHGTFGYKLLHKNLYIDADSEFIDQEQNSISFSNMNRLGLLENTGSYILSDGQIDNREDLISFKNTAPYKETKGAVDFSREHLTQLSDFPDDFKELLTVEGPYLRINSIELTAVGRAFYQTLFN